MKLRTAVLLILAAVVLFVTVYGLQAHNLYRSANIAHNRMVAGGRLICTIRGAQAAAYAHEGALRACLLGRSGGCQPEITLKGQTLQELVRSLDTLVVQDSPQKTEVSMAVTAADLKVRLATQVASKPDSHLMSQAAEADRRLFGALARLDTYGQVEHASQEIKYTDEIRSCYLFSLAAFIALALGTGVSLYRIYESSRHRSAAEVLARTTEARYRMLVEGSDLVLIVTDRHGTITFASDNVAHLTGYACDVLVGKPLNMFLGVDRIDEPAATGHEREHTFVNSAGEEQWAAYRVNSERNAAGEVVEYRIVAWDIDREKRMRMAMQNLEESRRQQQQLFQDVIDNLPNMVYLKDLDGNYVMVNRHMRELFGSRDVVGRRLQDLLGSEDDEARMLRADAQVLKEREQVSFEEHYVIDGEERYFWEVKFPVFAHDGAVRWIGGIATDISVRKREENALREAKAEAEQARRAQEAFMAAMSHEIRTPMNGIVGMGNLLAGTRLDNEQREFTDTILESARNLLAIINDLLDFSKIESGHFEFERTPFRLRHALKKALHPLRFKAEEKGLKLELDVPANVPEVLVGDPLRLQQVIINLVSNALKFTPEGMVEVKAFAEAEGSGAIMLHLEVCDTGIGIQPDKIQYVFESFTQQHAAIARSYGGTGLGLAIVRQLVELQGGTVGVSSQLGKGSTFKISIPFEVSQEAPDVARAPLRPEERSTLLVGLSILVAEDNPINQKVVRTTLTRQGAEVTIVENGRLAVDALAGSGHYDAILMDLQMPEMDGYEATRRIRKELRSNIPIIAMTADALVGEDERTRAAGMTGFVSKPFDPADLYQKLLALTASRVPTPSLLPPLQEEAPANTGTLPEAKSAQPPAAPVVDLSSLVADSGDDPSYLRDVISLFLRSVPESLDQLDRLVAEGTDRAEIRKTAHGLKSSFGVVRVKGFLEGLARIETLALGEDGHADMQAQMRQLLRMFRQARAELDAVGTEA